MNFDKYIAGFVSGKVGGICITDMSEGTVVFADKLITELWGEGVVGMPAAEALGWFGECPALGAKGTVEWEYLDTDTKRFFRIVSGLFGAEDGIFSIHQLSDITGYMSLNRDVTKYMSFFKKLSSFQNAVMEKLSDSYYELLPMLTDYFKSGRAYIFIQRGKDVDIISYDRSARQFTNDRTALEGDGLFSEEAAVMPVSGFPEGIKAVFLSNGAAPDSAVRPVAGGNASGQLFAIYLEDSPNLDVQSLGETMLRNVIRLYIENGILQEKLLYDSEHDMLTGLYNKGKYLELTEGRYQSLDSICVFNFDVNNLKKMNDTYGHEAGDKLILKAAASIRKVTDNRVYGFRTGGDEFMMIAADVTEAEANNILMRWEKELARLNEADDGINCVIAVGTSYGTKGYDLRALLADADERMYEDKKKKKKPGEEIR